MWFARLGLGVGPLGLTSLVALGVGQAGRYGEAWDAFHACHRLRPGSADMVRGCLYKASPPFSLALAESLSLFPSLALSLSPFLSLTHSLFLSVSLSLSLSLPLSLSLSLPFILGAEPLALFQSAYQSI